MRKFEGLERKKYSKRYLDTFNTLSWKLKEFGTKFSIQSKNCLNNLMGQKFRDMLPKGLNLTYKYYASRPVLSNVVDPERTCLSCGAARPPSTNFILLGDLYVNEMKFQKLYTEFLATKVRGSESSIGKKHNDFCISKENLTHKDTSILSHTSIVSRGVVGGTNNNIQSPPRRSSTSHNNTKQSYSNSKPKVLPKMNFNSADLVNTKKQLGKNKVLSVKQNSMKESQQGQVKEEARRTTTNDSNSGGLKFSPSLLLQRKSQLNKNQSKSNRSGIKSGISIKYLIQAKEKLKKKTEVKPLQSKSVSDNREPFKLSADLLLAGRNNLKKKTEVKPLQSKSVSDNREPFKLSADLLLAGRNSLKKKTEVKPLQSLSVSDNREPFKLSADLLLAGRNNLKKKTETKPLQSLSVSDNREPFKLSADLLLAGRNSLKKKSDIFNNINQNNINSTTTTTVASSNSSTGVGPFGFDLKALNQHRNRLKRVIGNAEKENKVSINSICDDSTRRTSSRTMSEELNLKIRGIKKNVSTMVSSDKPHTRNSSTVNGNGAEFLKATLRSLKPTKMRHLN